MTYNYNVHIDADSSMYTASYSGKLKIRHGSSLTTLCIKVHNVVGDNVP